MKEMRKKNEDDIKNNKICPWFLLNLGKPFLGLAQLSKILLFIILVWI
jgi:hypothetical protein